MVIIALIAALVLAGIDQLLKYFAAGLNGAEPLHILKAGDMDILTFGYYRNTGAAFSSFQGKIPVLIIVTVLFIAVMTVYLIKKRSESKFENAMFAMIIGGGIGNLIDRIFLGYVVDYIILWPFTFIFNFADICVVMGAILLLIYYFFFEKDDSPQKAPSQEAENHE